MGMRVYLGKKPLSIREFQNINDFILVQVKHLLT